ncbi:hypothetical protein M670_00145 [Schinkia azotoformans MEV2011]|uniref:Uncharacterized protein n=1 Tax=Schinkia azotoformans MEV2011 TaxID=1348973 RepID=A0A072NR51_SCHAZ|nr:hypothetical protein [Schinkia azotoformans]KEF40129.1 hypothetical protein M670_00145 [Schinkia azotoformans MEV2011]
MTVKELINELLECDMNATVDFDIDTTEENINTNDFEVYEHKRYVTFVIEPKDYVVIDKNDYEEMKERLYELEDAIEE